MKGKYYTAKCWQKLKVMCQFQINFYSFSHTYYRNFPYQRLFKIELFSIFIAFYGYKNLCETGALNAWNIFLNLIASFFYCRNKSAVSKSVQGFFFSEQIKSSSKTYLHFNQEKRKKKFVFIETNSQPFQNYPTLLLSFVSFPILSLSHLKFELAA